MKILRMTHKKKCLCASESKSTPEVVQNVALDLLPSLLKNPPAFHKPPATNPPLLPRPLHSHFLPMTARFISPHSCSGLAAQGRHCPPPTDPISRSSRHTFCSDSALFQTPSGSLPLQEFTGQRSPARTRGRMGAGPARWHLTWFLILIPQRELKGFLAKWFSSLTVGGKHLGRESINELMWQQPLFLFLFL